jgi:hypothetical protein
LQDYGEVLSCIFKTALSWAYELEVQFPKEDMEIALKGLKNADSESFASFFHLWRFVSFKLPLPIPRLERIVPFGDLPLECSKVGVRYTDQVSLVKYV